MASKKTLTRNNMNKLIGKTFIVPVSDTSKKKVGVEFKVVAIQKKFGVEWAVLAPIAGHPTDTLVVSVKKLKEEVKGE